MSDAKQSDEKVLPRFFLNDYISIPSIPVANTEYYAKDCVLPRATRFRATVY